jgi:LmbE family N-acetylglucosaminyl deacetylase
VRVKVLSLAPHPDDEVLGAGATLLALRDAGHEVVSGACGLGGDPERRARREAEARESCRRLGLEFRLAPDPAEVLHEGWDLVVAPHRADAHPAHARVARAVDAHAGATPTWRWALWGSVPAPSLLVPFGEARLAELQHALEAHASELERLDLRSLLRARARLAAVTGPELVLGFGGRHDLGAPYAELLAEDPPGAPRILDAAAQPA